MVHPVYNFCNWRRARRLKWDLIWPLDEVIPGLFIFYSLSSIHKFSSKPHNKYWLPITKTNLLITLRKFIENCFNSTYTKKNFVVKFRALNVQSAGTTQIFREFLWKWPILRLILASYKTMLFADLQLLWLCNKVVRLQSVEQTVSWYLSHRVTQLGLLRESLNRGSGH